MLRSSLCSAFLVLSSVGVADAQQPGPVLIPVQVEGNVVVLTPQKIAIREGNGKTVELQLSKVLATNHVPKEAGDGAVLHECWSYRPSDVQIGDAVEIVTERRTDGKFVCEAIMICRRPGGKVPLAPNEKFDPKCPQFSHAYRMNAHQALEEKGTPLPNCLVAPWAPERKAPMPRLVKTRSESGK